MEKPQDFVTLAEALAILPLLPAAEDWLGPSICSFDIVSRDPDLPTRKARFLMHVVDAVDGTRRRWVIQNKVLMDGVTLEMIAAGALAGSPVETVSLLLHEKMDLERKLALRTAELSMASENDEEIEIILMRDALEEVVADRDRLAAALGRAQARGERPPPIS